MNESLRKGPGAIISSGQSLSAPMDIGSDSVLSLSMPPAWDAANLTLQSSPDGGNTWQDVYDKAGVELAIIAAANRFIVLDVSTFEALRGIRNLRVRSGTASTPVNQTANRTIVLFVL